ncbi:MAG: ATP-binding protein [Cellulomonas sp.]|nr:ATP-binding protein [Cellulomonas sp.]
MTTQAGVLSIESANVFAILRTWLYAEPDIVFRELVSNAADAVAKLRDLARRGQAAAPAGRIDVVLDAAARTATISDDGLGMTADEVDRYLNQIAFSGASDFIERYRDADDDAIIGHFGVGFYSAFMLAERVEVDTRSYLPGAQPVHWECTSAMEYSLGAGARERTGTTVTLHLAVDSPYLVGPEAARDAVARYFAFLPVAVHVTFRTGSGEVADGHDAVLISDDAPVWRRAGAGAAVEPGAMREFYRTHFDDPFDPLFWIPVTSLDLGLRGVVFLRDTRGGAREIEGRLDVYSRGVLVGTDLAGLAPKFLGLHSIVLECDELPLVVSRSGVRTDDPRDGVPALVGECLTQEVIIALHTMATQDRPTFERLWPEIGSFVKYGVLTDRTFASVLAKRLLFADLDGRLGTLAEHLGTLAEHLGDPPATTVLYTSDLADQALLVDVFRRNHLPALVLDRVIDQPLLRAMESAQPGLTFRRLDADPVALLAAPSCDLSPAQCTALADEVGAALGERVPGATVQVVGLSVPDLPVLLTADEASRRTGDLAQLYGLTQGREIDDQGLVERTVVVNGNSTLVGLLVACQDPPARELAIAHLVDLALLTGAALGPETVPALLLRSQRLLEHFLSTR